MSYFVYVFSVVISSMLFICAAGTAAVAQNSEIPKEDFDRVRSTYKDFFAKESYRIRYLHETFPSEEAKQPEKTSSWVTEFAPPNREHHYHGLSSTDPNDKFERIVIGAEIFTNRGGTWKKLESSGGGSGFSSGVASAEYFVRGSEQIGNQMTTVYEVITGSRFSRGGGPMQTSFYSSKYWIGKDGRILKYVGESDALITKRSRTTHVYEYDPNIKIEAPIP